MSIKSANNLREYNDAKEAAKNGKGVVVSLETARSILTKYVSKEYENLKSLEDFKEHAIGGGFLVESQNKLFLMPLYDREENKIHISPEEIMDASDKLLLEVNSFIDVHRTATDTAELVRYREKMHKVADELSVKLFGQSFDNFIKEKNSYQPTVHIFNPELEAFANLYDYSHEIINSPKRAMRDYDPTYKKASANKSDNLYTTITGHQIIETINADIHILSSEIQGMNNDSPGNTFRKNSEIIADHRSFIESVKNNGLDTVYTIRDYNKWPNPAEKSYPIHLRLDKGINAPLISKHLQVQTPKVKQDFPILETQLRMINSFNRSGFPEIAETATAYYTSKLPLPVIFADKLCTTQGYGNHYAIMNNYHQANDQALYHDAWMKNVRPEEIKTVNTIKQEKIDLVTTEFNKFTDFLNDNKKDLANIKELQPALKKLAQNIKGISITNKSDHSL